MWIEQQWYQVRALLVDDGREKTALLFFACPINKSHLHPPTSLRVIFKLSRSPRKQTIHATLFLTTVQSSATYSYTFQKHRSREITELTITLTGDSHIPLPFHRFALGYIPRSPTATFENPKSLTCQKLPLAEAALPAHRLPARSGI